MTRDESADTDTAVDQVRRWEELGGIWRILDRNRDGELTVSLCRCDGGEEVDRIASADADLLAYIGNRVASDD